MKKPLVAALLGILGCPLALANDPPGYWVTTQGTLKNYSLTGALQSQSALPMSGDSFGYQVRDVVALTPQDVAIFNGTEAPRLLVGNGASWLQYGIPGWSTEQGPWYGGIARSATHVYLTDTLTADGQSGLIKVDPVTGAAQRVTIANFYDVAVGASGLVYSLASPSGLVNVFDPAQQYAQVQQVFLANASNVTAIAVDGAGNLYSASRDRYIARHSATGAELKRISVDQSLVDIDVHAASGRVLAGSIGGIAYLTDSQLATPARHVVGTAYAPAFVGFAEGAATPPPPPPPPPPVPSYCAASGSTTSYEWIQRVAVGSSGHTSGNNNGYFNGVSQTLNLAVGSNSFVLTPGYRSSAYTERWMVAVDTDGNGSFDRTATATGSGPVSLAMPFEAALVGRPLRLRVLMSFGTISSPCSSPYYGEVEDYTAIVR